MHSQEIEEGSPIIVTQKTVRIGRFRQNSVVKRQSGSKQGSLVTSETLESLNRSQELSDSFLVGGKLLIMG